MEIVLKKNEIINKHILAVDYGQKFTGLSNYRVGIDPFILLFGRLQYHSDESLAQEIIKIVEDEFIDIIVLGIPRFTDGTESTMTAKVKSFGELLVKSVKIPVFYVDETLTTFEAEERMKNDPRFNFQVDMKQIDAVSASIILETFVNSSSDS